MWPTLFSIGFISVPTATVILVLGFLVAGFSFWRRGKEEHYSELQLMDGFILSYLFGVIGARLTFIILHFDQFGWRIFDWLSINAKPGSIGLAFLVFATLFMYRFARIKKWDAYEVLDFWSISLTLWLIFRSLADLMSGAGRGRFTDWFVGVIFPGSIEKTHPAQLYLALCFILLYFFLHWSESRYRIFDWYRMGRKSAQTGFMISTFTIFFSLISALMLLVRLPEFVVVGLSLDGWLYLLGIIIGVQMLLRRSDKPLLPKSFKEKFSREKADPFAPSNQVETPLETEIKNDPPKDPYSV